MWQSTEVSKDGSWQRTNWSKNLNQRVAIVNIVSKPKRSNKGYWRVENSSDDDGKVTTVECSTSLA